MILHTVGAIRREFNRQPQAAITHAFEKLSHAEKLSHDDQMELAGIFARGASQGRYEAVSAAGCVLENIASVGRNGKAFAPQFYNTLLNVIGHGRVDESVANYARANAILKANLTDEEKSALVDAIAGSKELGAAIDGASRVLKEASETRISFQDASKLADVLRRGLTDENYWHRQRALERIVEAVRYSPMRNSHCSILEDLMKDAGNAFRSGNINTLDEDNRAFLNRILAFTAGGPVQVPSSRPEPRSHGIVVS